MNQPTQQTNMISHDAMGFIWIYGVYCDLFLDTSVPWLYPLRPTALSMRLCCRSANRTAQNGDGSTNTKGSENGWCFGSETIQSWGYPIPFALPIWLTRGWPVDGRRRSEVTVTFQPRRPNAIFREKVLVRCLGCGRWVPIWDIMGPVGDQT